VRTIDFGLGDFHEPRNTRHDSRSLTPYETTITELPPLSVFSIRGYWRARLPTIPLAIWILSYTRICVSLVGKLIAD
jgi:hypothetical protein